MYVLDEHIEHSYPADHIDYVYSTLKIPQIQAKDGKSTIDPDLVGKFAEKGWDRNSRIPLAMLIGNVSIYVFGLIWLGIFIGSGVKIPGIELTYFDAISGSGVIDKTLRGGLYPFIAGDALKLLLAMLAVPGIWSIVKRIKDKFQNGD